MREGERERREEKRKCGTVYLSGNRHIEPLQKNWCRTYILIGHIDISKSIE